MKKVGYIFLIFLAGCNGRYASLGKSMSDCGFWTSAYSEFHSCMDAKVAVNASGPRDYYAQTSVDIQQELDHWQGQIDAKSVNDKEAFTGFREFVHQKTLEEQKSAQVAGTIVAVGLVGVAAASCANTGCLGGGGYNNAYSSNYVCGSSVSLQGCCSYHGGVACGIGGPMCTMGKVQCNDGAASPTCACPL